MDHLSVQRLSDGRLRGRSRRELVAARVTICLDFRDSNAVSLSELECAAWSTLWGRAYCAGTQAAEARPVLLLHCTAELLSSRWTSDAGHHPGLQAGKSAQQLALLGLHHWCTAVLSAASRGPPAWRAAHRASGGTATSCLQGTVITSYPLGLTIWAPPQTSIQSVRIAHARNPPF